MAAAKPFWIVFDTSQYRDYYEDVHNLLALPANTTLRYNYRDSLLTAEALELVPTPILPVLFIYAQRNTSYDRLNGRSEPRDPAADFNYVATRCGTMLRVVPIGDRLHFDFTVDHYPQNNAPFHRIARDLCGRSAVPPEVYVATSSMTEDLQAVLPSDDDRSWQEIVSLLGSPPMQFSRDAFWRLIGPFKKRGAVTKPSISDGTAVFHSVEFKSLRMGLKTDSGRDAVNLGLDYTVDAASSDKIITIQGSKQYAVRHYSHADITYATAAAPALFTKKLVELQFSTTPRVDWPSGPNVKLQYSVSRSIPGFILSAVMLVVGAILCSLGATAKVLNYRPWNPLGDILIIVFGLILFVYGLWRITGKFGFQSPV